MNLGWKVEKLGEVIQLEYGKPLPDSKRKPNGKYPVYGANGEKDRSDEYYYDKPSIIVGRKGSAGEINLTETRFWPLDVSYFVTFDNKKYNLHFLYYLLSNLELTKLAKGVKPGINRNEVYSIDVNIPPLPEQQRIVSVLDEAFASIAQVKANAERNLVNARELFESVSQEVFDTNGKCWEEKKLGDKNIIEIIDNDRGVNYPKKSDFHAEGYCLFMNTKNVRPDGFDFTTTMFITEKKDKALGKGKLSRNDVVMTTRGTIGNLGIYTDKVPFEQLRTNSGMLIFRPNTNHILPEFLFEVLRSGLIKAQIKKHVSGAAQPQLPIKTLVNFSFHLPKSLAEQRAIVARLEALSAETKRLEAIYQRKLEVLEELRRSVLARAFEGEL